MAVWGRVSSITKISTGVYRINHNIKDTKYTAILTLQQSGRQVVLAGVYPDYCIVNAYNLQGGITDAVFTVILVRTPY